MSRRHGRGNVRMWTGMKRPEAFRRGAPPTPPIPPPHDPVVTLPHDAIQDWCEEQGQEADTALMSATDAIAASAEWVKRRNLALADEAMKTIREVMLEGGRYSGTQLAAALNVLNRVVGKPVEEHRVTGPGGGPVQHQMGVMIEAILRDPIAREAAELVQRRLEALASGDSGAVVDGAVVEGEAPR